MQAGAKFIDKQKLSITIDVHSELADRLCTIIIDTNISSDK